MKFNQKNAKVQTNISEKKRIHATIDNPVKMLRMFTKDLYKNPLQTAIQEYINNAKDAHKMVGKDTSTIEIFAPTVANQTIIIRDYGPGLSPDDIVNIFARITASNKDNSNLFNGGYGIGSKSWFAINSSFYVLSRFQGVKTYYEVSFTDNIYIDVIDEEPTSEPNGVEVHLPLATKEQISESFNSIKRAIKFWEVRPVLHHMELKPLPCIYDCNDFKIIAIEEGRKTNIAVTLGDTQYSVTDLPSVYAFKNKIFGISVQIKFNIGEVQLDNPEVGPDREAFSKGMENFIVAKLEKVQNKLSNILQNAIKKASDPKDIQLIINNPHYENQTYTKKIDGKNIDLLYTKRGSFPFYKNLKGYWEKPINSFLYNKDMLPCKENSSITFIVYPNSLSSLSKNSVQKTNISKFGTKGYFIFITEESYQLLKEDIKEIKGAIVKNATDVSLEIPKNFQDLLNETDPIVTITHELSLVKNNDEFKLTVSSNKKLKVSELDKKIPFIETNYYVAHHSDIRKLKLKMYVVSTKMGQILSKFKFTKVNPDDIKTGIKKLKEYEAEKRKKEQEKIKAKQEEYARTPEVQNVMKWDNLFTWALRDYLRVDEYEYDRVVSFITELIEHPYVHKVSVPKFNEFLNIQRKISSVHKFNFPQEENFISVISQLVKTSPVLIKMFSEYINNDLELEDIKQSEEIMFLIDRANKILNKPEKKPTNKKKL